MIHINKITLPYYNKVINNLYKNTNALEICAIIPWENYISHIKTYLLLSINYMKWDYEREWMMDEGWCMKDDGWWGWWRDVKLKAEALVLIFELNLSVVQTVTAAVCNFSLENVDVSMGVHFRIARGARVSWFPSNDLANTSSLHFIRSIYRRWVVGRSVAGLGGEPSLSTGGGLPRTCASEYPASSATHLVSSEMGFSIFPWGLNRSLSL